MSDSILFDVPNLDDLSIDPVNYDKAGMVLTLLAIYCRHQATAMRARRAGQIHAAEMSERACEETYQQLPGWARW
jgi:hypothetical protein